MSVKSKLSLCVPAKVVYGEVNGRLEVVKVKRDYTGWLLRAKRDGVLVGYRHKTRTLEARTKGSYVAPEWWLDQMPPYDLQGELTYRSGDRFNELSGTARRSEPKLGTWDDIILAVFDLPDHPKTYMQRTRLLDLREKRGALGPKVMVIPWIKIENNDHLIQVANKMMDRYEGVVIYDPNGLYVRDKKKRDPVMEKIISYYREEAVITAHIQGKGRPTLRPGWIGAYEIKSIEGPDVEFKVSVGNDENKERPLPIGTVIVVEHKGRVGMPSYVGQYVKPRQPTYKGVRPVQDLGY